MAVGDLVDVASVFAEREGVDLDRAREVVSRWAAPVPEQLALVAVHQDRVQGYGRAKWLVPEDQGGDAPAGWYLTGLVVAPAARRHGLGARLTEARIATLAPVANEVWYFANMRNRVTIALHERHGFTLHTHEFSIPGVAFENGQGALFRLSIARD